MNAPPSLAPAEREDLIRSAWYSHDARWFSTVAADCGMEVANRANRQAIRQAGIVEARRLSKHLDLPPVRSLDAFFAFTDTGRDLFVGSIVDLAVRKTGELSYEVEVTKCFAAENIARAGLAESYECGIFDRIEGWHEGLGLPLAEPVPRTLCHLANGRRCTRRLDIVPTPTANSRP